MPRVLLVEDSNYIIERIAKKLRARGHTVVEARSLEQARTAINEAARNNEPFDILVTDNNFPETPGFSNLRDAGIDLAKQVRGDSRGFTADFRVIMQTTRVSWDGLEAEDLLSNGKGVIDLFLPKDHVRIADAVDELSQSRSATAKTSKRSRVPKGRSR